MLRFIDITVQIKSTFNLLNHIGCIMDIEDDQQYKYLCTEYINITRKLLFDITTEVNSYGEDVPYYIQKLANATVIIRFTSKTVKKSNMQTWFKSVQKLQKLYDSYQESLNS